MTEKHLKPLLSVTIVHSSKDGGRRRRRGMNVSVIWEHLDHTSHREIRPVCLDRSG